MKRRPKCCPVRWYLSRESEQRFKGCQSNSKTNLGLSQEYRSRSLRLSKFRLLRLRLSSQLRPLIAREHRWQAWLAVNSWWLFLSLQLCLLYRWTEYHCGKSIPKSLASPQLRLLVDAQILNANKTLQMSFNAGGIPKLRLVAVFYCYYRRALRGELSPQGRLALWLLHKETCTKE